MSFLNMHFIADTIWQNLSVYDTVFAEGSQRKYDEPFVISTGKISEVLHPNPLRIRYNRCRTNCEVATMKEILLISRAVRGDRKALEQLIRLYYEKIFDYIAFHIHDQSIAEDLTQDVFLKLVKSISSYVPTASFSAFLYRIARNTVIDYTRTVKQADEIPEDTASADQYSAIDAKLTVQSLLAQLPEDQRECVILYYIKGLKYREISHVLDIPVPTAKSRVQRGLAACKKRMEEVQ